MRHQIWTPLAWQPNGGHPKNRETGFTRASRRQAARTFAGAEAVHDPENKQTGPGFVRSTKRFSKETSPSQQDGKHQVYRVGRRSVRSYSRLIERGERTKKPGT